MTALTCRATVVAIALATCASPVSSQSGDLPEYTVYRTAELMTIDGVLDESSWQAAPTVVLGGTMT